MSELVVVLSCEHGGHRVPARWGHLFEGAGELLVSHRGWDAGALSLARGLARSLGAPLFATTVTRLLVDPNRSLGHPQLFSTFSRALPPGERERVMAACYRPHREAVQAAVQTAIDGAGSVLHVGVHSFTPVLDGRVRSVDIGLLYDPSREPERHLAARWLASTRARLPGLRVRANTPYRGTSDGLVTFLRRRFQPARYSGIELEVGQGLLNGRGRFPAPMARGLAAALADIVGMGSS